MKNINLRKVGIAILALGCVLVPSAKADTYTVKEYSPVYYQSSEDSKLLGHLEAGTEVKDVISGDNGYTLITLDNNYGYINNDNLAIKDYDQLDFKTYRRADILRATESVNLRKGPSTDYDKIMTIQGNTEVECIGIAENGWYLIRVNGHIGYASPDYFQAFSDYSMNNYGLDYGSLGFICNGYTTDRVNLRAGASTDYQSFGLLDQGSFVQVLQECGDFYLVLDNDYQYGYISKDYVHLLNNEIYVVTDFSSQTTTLYNGNDVMIQDYCVTGKGKHQTALGVFKIKSKERNRYLNGTNDDGSTYHSFVKYWMPFNGGQGIHDASWRGSFGPSVSGTTHGCENEEENVAECIFENVEVGTIVINKK